MFIIITDVKELGADAQHICHSGVPERTGENSAREPAVGDRQPAGVNQKVRLSWGLYFYSSVCFQGLGTFRICRLSCRTV